MRLTGLIVLLLPALAAANSILGIDLGTSFFKVRTMCFVMLKPEELGNGKEDEEGEKYSNLQKF